MDWQCKSHKLCKESLWSKLEPIQLDTSKLEQLFESKSKELPVTKVTWCCTAVTAEVRTIQYYDILLGKAVVLICLGFFHIALDFLLSATIFERIIL